MNKQERVIEKIRKLLAMADEDGGASDQERATAMRQATKLMDMYAVDLDTIEVTDDSDPRGKDKTEIGRPVWKAVVFAAIGRLYGCVVYQENLGRGKKNIVVIGRTSARLAILSMGTWLISSIEKEVRERGIDRGAGRRDSFRKGAAIGIGETVDQILKEREQGKTVEAAGTALVVVESYKNELAANQDYLQQQGVRLSKSRSMKLSNQGAFSQGRSYGKSIGLNPQMNGAGQKRIR